MKGLLRKDLYNLKEQIKVYLILPMMAIFFAVQMDSLESAQAIFGMLIILIPISSFAYDEYSDFNSYALTLPLRRSDLVYSKYLLSFLVGIVSFLIALLTTLILYTVFGDTHFIGADMRSIILAQSIAFFGIFLMAAMLFPILFKYGSNKGRMIMVILFVSFSIACYAIFSLDITISASFIDFVLRNIIWIAIILFVVVFALSILSSIRIMKNKEF